MKRNLILVALAILGAVTLFGISEDSPVVAASGNTTSNMTIYYGDSNRNGQINVQDITLTERMILGLYPFDISADANQDGAVNMADVTQLEYLIMGLRKPVPVPVQ